LRHWSPSDARQNLREGELKWHSSEFARIRDSILTSQPKA
jgi:hypothetical protein